MHVQWEKLYWQSICFMVQKMTQGLSEIKHYFASLFTYVCHIKRPRHIYCSNIHVILNIRNVIANSNFWELNSMVRYDICFRRKISYVPLFFYCNCRDIRKLNSYSFIRMTSTKTLRFSWFSLIHLIWKWSTTVIDLLNVNHKISSKILLILAQQEMLKMPS